MSQAILHLSQKTLNYYNTYIYYKQRYYISQTILYLIKKHYYISQITLYNIL